MTIPLQTTLLSAIDANPKGVYVVTAIPASNRVESQCAAFSTHALARAWIKSVMGEYTRFEIEPMVVDEELGE